MSDEISLVTLTPVDGYITDSIGNSDVYIIDCSDLGGLGLYTYSDNWIATTKIIITTRGSLSGVSVLYGHIYRSLVTMTTHKNYITYETTCSAIGGMILSSYGDDIAVSLDITSDLTLAHAIFVECNVQKFGG